MYPYKIGEYKYSLLTDPIEIGGFDYYAESYSDEVGYDRENVVTAAFKRSGRCDAVVIWVDYDLTKDRSISLNCYARGMFSYHTKVSIKFFESPVDIALRRSSLVEEHSDTVLDHCMRHLVVKTNFSYGDSDSSYQFSIIST